jgi:hypothetical protein
LSLLDAATGAAEDGFMAPEDKAYVDSKVETMRALLDGFSAVMAERLTALRVELIAEMDKRTAVLREEIQALRVEMHKNTADIIKWMVGLTIGSLAIFISTMAFMLSNVNVALNNVNVTVAAALKAVAAAPAAAQQPVAPVIIQLPANPAPAGKPQP